MVAISQMITLMPDGYEEQCREMGIIQRRRAIKKPADLMLLNLYHLVNGCTLNEISEVGRLTKIGEYSDVAYMKKFEKCTRWFQWVSAQLATTAVADYTKPAYLKEYRVLGYDGTMVVEKGRSGRSYWLHYCIDIFKMSSVFHRITNQDVGETLLNCTFQKGDLVTGDRIYGTIKGITHCVECGADYILRLKTNCFTIWDAHGNKIDILDQLRDMDYEESKGFTGYICSKDGKRISIRICAKRKTKEACEATAKKLQRRATRKQERLTEETKQMNEYIVVATSLPAEISDADILETYRYRWQVECYFKRLKSIMDFGDLPKKRNESSLAWLNGKIMVALLMELILTKGSFSPQRTHEPKTEYMERNQDDQPDLTNEHSVIICSG